MGHGGIDLLYGRMLEFVRHTKIAVTRSPKM